MRFFASGILVCLVSVESEKRWPILERCAFLKGFAGNVDELDYAGASDRNKHGA